MQACRARDGCLHGQVEAHHYCGCPNDEFRQCIIYDSDKPDARLIGIEYIISRRLFQGLPEEEKKLWHSHKFEVGKIALHSSRYMLHALLHWHAWCVGRGHPVRLAECCSAAECWFIALCCTPNMHRWTASCLRIRAQVMSGQLYAPGVPQVAEQAEMQKLVDTYGKTWHTWQVPPAYIGLLP